MELPQSSLILAAANLFVLEISRYDFGNHKYSSPNYYYQTTVRTNSTPRRLCYLLMLISLCACQRVSQRPTLQSLLQDPLVQVYFNQSEDVRYLEPYRQKTRQGDNLETHIIDTIAQAQSTVDVAVQELNLPLVAQALVARQKAGVKVRVILENNYSRSGSSLTTGEIAKLKSRERQKYQELHKFIDTNKDGQLSSTEINTRDALVILSNGKVPLIDDTADGSKGSGLMHHKFLVVDNRFVIVTSANFTLSGTHGDYSNDSSLGNANNLLKIDSPELATLFTQEFNIMWGDGVGGKADSKFGLKKQWRSPQTIALSASKITVQFSPTSPTQPWSESSNGLIAKTINTAHESVDMALFVFSEQRLANILENRHENNVQIRALLEPDFAFRSYSEGLDMMGISQSNKCKYELDNNPWKNPIKVGIPLLNKGDLLHHKYAVIDHKTVIAGSHNWSVAANHQNDETLLVIENPVVAAHYQREFARLNINAQTEIPPGVKRKIETQSKKCLKNNL